MNKKIILCLTLLSCGWQDTIDKPDPVSAILKPCSLVYTTTSKVVVYKHPTIPNRIVLWLKFGTYCVPGGPYVANNCDFEVTASLRIHDSGNIWRDIPPAINLTQRFSDPCKLPPNLGKYRDIFLQFDISGPGRYEGDVYVWLPSMPLFVELQEYNQPPNLKRYPVQFDINR